MQLKQSAARKPQLFALAAQPSVRTSEVADARAALAAGALTLAGVILSGPVAVTLVNVLAPQPGWKDAATFAAHYHRLQLLPYALGFLLILGSIMMVSALARSAAPAFPMRARLATILCAVFASFIFLNYLIQTTYIPALLADAQTANAVLIEALSMAHPRSLAWALEMWGYAFLGAALWLVAPALARTRLERTTAALLTVNGVVSIAGALLTALQPGWVAATAGRISFAAWNALMTTLAVCFLLAWQRRLSAAR